MPESGPPQLSLMFSAPAALLPSLANEALAAGTGRHLRRGIFLQDQGTALRSQAVAGRLSEIAGARPAWLARFRKHPLHDFKQRIDVKWFGQRRDAIFAQQVLVLME